MLNPEDEKLNINVRLLRKIQKAILAEPERFDMSDWLKRFHFDSERERILRANPSTPLTCGTAACIAGWALPLAGIRLKDMHVSDIPDEAQRLLGLTDEQAASLFYLPEDASFDEEGWPEQFSEKYIRDSCCQEDFVHNAKIAAARIDWFIKTKGAE